MQACGGIHRTARTILTHTTQLAVGIAAKLVVGASWQTILARRFFDLILVSTRKALVTLRGTTRIRRRHALCTLLALSRLANFVCVTPRQTFRASCFFDLILVSTLEALITLRGTTRIRRRRADCTFVAIQVAILSKFSWQTREAGSSSGVFLILPVQAIFADHLRRIVRVKSRQTACAVDLTRVGSKLSSRARNLWRERKRDQVSRGVGVF